MPARESIPDNNNPNLSWSRKPIARKLFAVVTIGFMLGLTAHTSSEQIAEAKQLVAQTCDSDGVCDLNENDATCSSDCLCNNNGVCEAGQEHYLSCPADCPSPGVCGDGVCDGEEDFENCFFDCLPPTPTKKPTSTRTPTPKEGEATATPSPTASATASPTVTSTDTPIPATASQEPTETDTPVPPPTKERASETPTQAPDEAEAIPVTLPTSTPITPIMSCNIVGTDDVRDEIRSAVVDKTNNASVTWVLCTDAPAERCLPIVPSERVMEDLSAVRLIDCNAKGECSEFSPIESTEQQLCFKPVTGNAPLDCTNGCALAIESTRPLILGNVPLWVILLGAVPLGLGIFGLIVFLLSTRNIPDEEMDEYDLDQDITFE
jgi:hypothetical protein